jgi:hypothetical protein
VDQQFLDAWHARVAGALDDALDFLAAHDENPWSDGVLGEWVRELCAFRFQEHNLSAIAALIRKRDPHLCEAGLLLGAAAVQHVGGVEQLEPALVELVRGSPLDSWILLALVALLGKYLGPLVPQLTPVYRALVTRKRGAPPPERCIHRNRYIAPERELEQLYEQQALQTLQPTERDLVYLPILEARHHTSGWRPTVLKILETMGLDPAQHEKALSRR